jgi:hypothetical protein
MMSPFRKDNFLALIPTASQLTWLIGLLRPALQTKLSKKNINSIERTLVLM